NDVSASEVHAKLDAAEGSRALSKRTIECWVLAFNNENESVEDKPHSGRLREATTPETINKVKELVIKDPHTTTKELSDFTGIFQAQITNILTNELGMRKELAGRHFERIENFACAVNSVINTIPNREYKKCFQDWQNQLKHCIEVGRG
ncbi:17616_t:CDS:2, partial [Cetraspora pellucida]